MAPFITDVICRINTYRPHRAWVYFLVHSAHAAHAGISGHRGFGFLDVAHHALGSQQHAGNAGSVVNISKKTKTTHVHIFIRDE